MSRHVHDAIYPAVVPCTPFPTHSQAVTHYKDPKVIAEVSCNLGEAMVGIDCRTQDFVSMANRSE